MKIWTKVKWHVFLAHSVNTKSSNCLNTVYEYIFVYLSVCRLSHNVTDRQTDRRQKCVGIACAILPIASDFPPRKSLKITFCTRSLAVGSVADRTGYRWPLTFKVNNFYVIWKPIYYFLIVINSNLDPISHHFRDTVTNNLKLFIENCGQTAAGGYMFTIDGL